MDQPFFTKYFTLLFIVLMIGWGCTSESGREGEPGTASTDTLAQQDANLQFADSITTMDGIRAEAQKMMQAVNSGAVDSTSFSYDCHGEKKGIVTFYNTGDTLGMVERNYSEYSHTHGTERYFVSGGQPYFVYRKNTDWAFKSSNETVDSIKEQRFYVLGDTLVQCMTKEYEIHSDATDNPDPDEVASEPGQCPAISELMDQYQLLLSHNDTTRTIGCLQKE